jgi:hypothetical protein
MRINLLPLLLMLILICGFVIIYTNTTNNKDSYNLTIVNGCTLDTTKIIIKQDKLKSAT